MIKTDRIATFATRNSIFPVMLFDFAVDKPVSLETMTDFTYLGTGFFLYLDTCIAFITCRHVVDVVCRENQRIGIGALENNGKFWWDYMEYHGQADLAFARFEPSALMEFIHPLIPLRHEELLMLGSEVYSFGFPFTAKRIDSFTNRRSMQIHELFFSGHISTIYDRQYLEQETRFPFDDTYALSFECPMGLSGAPLLVTIENALYVAGVVYGNQSRQFTLDMYEQIDEAGKTTRHETAKLYHFGLACTHKVFSEIPALS